MQNLKFVFVGDAGTGKTRILETLCDTITTEEYGQNIASITLQVDLEEYKITLWDLPAQQRFQTLRKTFYQGASVIFIVFDLTRRSTFTGLAKWVREVADTLHYIPHLILFGTKLDMQDYHEISSEEIKNIAEKFDINYQIVSAINEESLKTAFVNIIRNAQKKAK